jgi:hypothetical protein
VQDPRPWPAKTVDGSNGTPHDAVRDLDEQWRDFNEINHWGT